MDQDSQVNASSLQREADALVRLTLYTTREKDFAIKYIALKKHQSLNKLLNDVIDGLLQHEGIDPTTLPAALP